jgi:hypothetical protein
MNAPSVDIREILEAYGESSGIGIADNAFFIGREPATPKNCITIIDVSGYPPEQRLDGVGYEYPAIHIRVRNTDYVAGWNLANEIKTVLHGLAQTVINSTLYSSISCSSGPAHLDWDENGNARFFINFNLQRRVA